MNIKSSLITVMASTISRQQEVADLQAEKNQHSIFQQLIKQGLNTQFGRDHHFASIKKHIDFANYVPLREYEDFRYYIDRVTAGEKNILWPGLPKYFAKTSGTTSGTKYIPISTLSIKNHIDSARNALFSYLYHQRKTKIFNGKMLFLSGSPELEWKNGIATGRLSGIVNHEIPAWISKNKLPPHDINILEPWEYKMDKLIDSIKNVDLTVISGIPPWIKLFCEKLLDATGKTCVADVYPNLELYIHGGVNYQPYHQQINSLIGKEIALVETYPASEGFIAYQDNYKEAGMRLIANHGIFYEFVEMEQLGLENPNRITLKNVEIGKDYALVISTNAGLWAYIIGDLIRFISIRPYKIQVSGRTSQFISAFGEHVIAGEIDFAMEEAQKKHSFQLVEFHVAPQVNPKDSDTAYHEWFIEFDGLESKIEEISQTLNEAMCNKNAYYKDLIEGKMLTCLKIRQMRKNCFLDYGRRTGRLGDQFKVQRLSNNRQMADELGKDIIQ